MTSGPQFDRSGTLLATVLGSSLTFIVGSIVNVALPRIQEGFNAGPAGAQWVVNAYLLPLGALVLLGGALGDHYGRRRVFLAGQAIFTLSCIMCAVAPTLPLLLAGRALEGVGAALIAPTSLAIIADAFAGEERGRAVGTWAAAGAAAGALAPVVGGAIIDVAGWRWAFAALVPFAAWSSWVAARSLRESHAERGERAPLDWAGAGLASLGLLGLTWGLTALSTGSADAATLVALGTGTGFLGAFLVVEHAKGDRAMTPLGIFADATFAGLSLLTFFLYAALGGLLVLLPYLLITDLGLGATAAGLALLPFPAVLGTMSQIVGTRPVERWGTRRVLVSGSVLVGLGFGLFARLPPEGASYARDVLPGLVALSLGMGLVVAPLTSAVLGAAGEAYAGVASGVNNALARVAGLIATALLGLVLLGPDEPIARGFAAAAWVGLALAAMSAASAFALIRDEQCARPLSSGRTAAPPPPSRRA